MRSFWWLLPLALVGCGGPTYQRGADNPGLDDPAMSTGLDKRDLQRLLSENLGALRESREMKAWLDAGTKPRVAIYPIANETSEHVESALQAMLSDVETYLVESGAFTVISVERQQQMLADIQRQHGGGFDPTKVAEYNKQLGAEYYVTGKVQSSDERSAEARRVQYFMYLQVIEVATSAIRWQHKSEVTKALAGLPLDGEGRLASR
jgi:TolB-like protein